jgi:hypothetical protein
MESDVVKVVPKVNNLGFVLNERITATNQEGVLEGIYWVLRSLRPSASHTPFEVRKRLVGMGVCWCGCCIATDVECGF